MVVYTGAGISTAAGIGDYASKAKGSVAGKPRTINRLEAQPTVGHHVLAALEKAGFLHHWVQQNHDGLAQKAGYPQDKINEIHGSWFDKKNPVLLMHDALRPDLFALLTEWANKTDLCLALGTSLCGMTSDCIATTVARKALSGEPVPGLVIINLQRTQQDQLASLRIFAKLDDSLLSLARCMRLRVEGVPRALSGGTHRRAAKPRRTRSTPRN
eukprot:TRINITY_DN16095_c0_g1_i1.p1 TRINITY_DN16095_c0_g1~~TRINITY_DN16095_c0_g1_i1.p1  ORF type:complete len:214 (+),score=23.44 TRINITY_DN16095_c0_g1_i1:378-1019(+)